MAYTHQPIRERSVHSLQQRGMTLVEVTVAVAISAFLLGIAVTMLVRIQSWDARFRDDAVSIQQLPRLAELIREDVRSATNVVLESPTLLTVNVQEERVVHYDLTPSGCLRIVEHPIGKEEQRNLFRVGRDLKWNVESFESGVLPNVTVTLELATDEETSRGKVLFVVSANRGAGLPQLASRNSAE
jgi:prepilin-type N-terminal cleavage/methylation domain-containing protein